MKYKIRIQIVDYTDDSQKRKCIRDLRAFLKIAHIGPLKALHLPGGDCFAIELDGLPEHTQLQYLHMLNLLSARNHNYIVELRDQYNDIYL